MGRTQEQESIAPLRIDATVENSDATPEPHGSEQPYSLSHTHTHTISLSVLTCGDQLTLHFLHAHTHETLVVIEAAFTLLARTATTHLLIMKG